MSGTRNLEELKTQALTCVEAAYDKGYKAAKQDIVAAGNKSEYERGLNDAEKAVRRLTVSIAAGGLTPGEKQMIFGLSQDYVILTNFSMSEIIEKIREYDDEKAERNASPDNDLHIGDEVYAHDKNVKKIVLGITDFGNFAVLSQNGNFGVFSKGELHKTGKTYPVAELIMELDKFGKGKE